MTQRRNQPVSKVAPCGLMRHNAACVAGMAEQVDARDSKSRAERRAGSIPAPGTKNMFYTVSRSLKTRSAFSSAGFLLSQAIAPCSITYQHFVGFFVGMCKTVKTTYQQPGEIWL
jgi:hypothetical protein